MHFHLDLVGGMAGDMFVGALMDLYPEYADAAMAAIRSSGIEPGVGLKHEKYTDGVLSGSRFDVELPKPEAHHHHVHWSTLRQTLVNSELASEVCERAVDIFAALAAAEAEVHRKPLDQVTFHEVGAWDSIADIVAAAFLIEALSPCTWSIGPIPIGSGRVRTEHGLLPVPAPATTLLLSGYQCFDDGFPGERVTPTGAAIIKHLQPEFGLGVSSRILERSAYGFGTRRFEGMSNVLRILGFSMPKQSPSIIDTVSIINFEIDDQTAEDLALGLNRLRATEGVIDVVQSAVIGKDGRQVTTVQVLAQPAKVDVVSNACFDETTTIGLRLQTVDRLILSRREATASGDINVKIVNRPVAATAKADIRHVSDVQGFANRDARRRSAELEVMNKIEEDR